MCVEYYKLNVQRFLMRLVQCAFVCNTEMNMRFFKSSALFIRVFFRSLSIYWKSTYSLHRLTPSSCNDHRNQLAMYSAQSTEHTCMSDWNEMKRVLCQRKSTQWKNCRLILLMFNKIVMQFSSLFFFAHFIVIGTVVALGNRQWTSSIYWLSHAKVILSLHCLCCWLAQSCAHFNWSHL